MSTWMVATPSSAQEPPANVQSTSTAERPGPQAAAAAINGTIKSRRIGPHLLLPQTSNGSSHSDGPRYSWVTPFGIVPPFRALTVSIVRGRNAPAMNGGTLNYVE